MGGASYIVQLLSIFDLPHGKGKNGSLYCGTQATIWENWENEYSAGGGEEGDDAFCLEIVCRRPCFYMKYSTSNNVTTSYTR